MNWKQFKECVEAQGVKDDDEINYIDIAYPHYYTDTNDSDMNVVTIADMDGSRTFQVTC